MKKLRARVGNRRDLAAELQAVKKKKRGKPSGSFDSPSVPREASDHQPTDRAPELHHSLVSKIQAPPVDPVDISKEVDPASSSLAKKVDPKVINLDGTPEGGTSSPMHHGEPILTDMAAHIPSSSTG